MPINHLSIPVSSLSASVAFYTAILKPLAYKVYYSDPAVAGFVAPQSAPDFWLGGPTPKDKIGHNHVAFAAENRAMVDEWHANAVYVLNLPFSSFLQASPWS